ncbi:MAG TPA: mechanosensitive ion channel domain-containing protein [Ktedonobacterales bacterium]
MEALTTWFQQWPPLVQLVAQIVFALALLAALQWALRVTFERVVSWLVRRSEAVFTLTPADRDARVRKAVDWPARLLALVIVMGLTRNLWTTGATADFIGKVVFSLTAIFLAYFAGRAITQLYLVPGRAFRTLGLTLDPAIAPLAQTVVWIIVVLFAVVAVLDRWGFDTAALLAGTGLLGLAVSLAAQDYAKNIFGFFVLVTERPFAIGDLVTIGAVTGTVEHIGWRSTSIRQQDQVLVIVPNGSMTTANIANAVRRAKRFLAIVVTVSYQEQPARVRTLMDAIAATMKARALVAPESVLVAVTQLSRDAIEITAQCDVLTIVAREYLAEQSAINLEVLRVVEDLAMGGAMPNPRLILREGPQAPQPASGAQADEATGHA